MSLPENRDSSLVLDSYEKPINNYSYNILIVDDEPINQRVLRGHLSDSLYNIQSIMSGPEALRIINENEQIDLVLLDLMMPTMSGYEVLEKIRHDYLPSEVPVIIVTAKKPNTRSY